MSKRKRPARRRNLRGMFFMMLLNRNVPTVSMGAGKGEYYASMFSLTMNSHAILVLAAATVKEGMHRRCNSRDTP
jgi:hypothetical protein